MPGTPSGMAFLRTWKKHAQAVQAAFVAYALTCLELCGRIWLCLQHEPSWQVQSWLRPLQKCDAFGSTFQQLYETSSAA